MESRSTARSTIQGWSLTIDLQQTELQQHTFFGRSLAGEVRWYECRVEGDQFVAACGPHDLTAVLEIFLAWAAPT